MIKLIGENNWVCGEWFYLTERSKAHQYNRVILKLKELAGQLGCYKVILACNDDNVPFYEKCGFKPKEVEMAWYIEAKL